jgi:hypothetical protein
MRQRKMRLDTAHLRLGKQKQIIHGDASHAANESSLARDRKEIDGL